MAAQAGAGDDLASLGPSTLVRALVAAVIAGMVSFPRALFAGIAIGVVQALIGFNFIDQPGLIDFLLLVAVLVAVVLPEPRTRPRGDADVLVRAQGRDRSPSGCATSGGSASSTASGLVVLGDRRGVLPLVVTQPSRHLLYTTILVFALCGLSLTVLTGWAGQLSLGQMAFAGIGAFLAAAFTAASASTSAWRHPRSSRPGIDAVPARPSLILAALLTAGLAALIGARRAARPGSDAGRQHVRVRARRDAVHVPASRSSAAASRPSVPFQRGTLFGLDLTDAAHLLLRGARRARRGRRSSWPPAPQRRRPHHDRACATTPTAPSAYTIKATRVKLWAFALAGGIAGARRSAARPAPSRRSRSTERSSPSRTRSSLVSIVVIGGIGSVSGAVLGALWVVGLPAFFPGNDDRAAAHLERRSAGAAALLPRRPRADRLRRARRACSTGWRVGSRSGRRRSDSTTRRRRCDRPERARRRRRRRCCGPSAIDACDFGGIVAVDGVSLEVGDGRDRRADRHQRRRQVDADERDRRLRAEHAARCRAPRRRRVAAGRRAPRARARASAARSRPRRCSPSSPSARRSQVALEARGRTGLLSTALCLPHAIRARATQARRGRRPHRLPRPRPLRRARASPTSRPAPGASSSSPACSRSTRACCASTSRPPASPSARPRRSAR